MICRNIKKRMLSCPQLSSVSKVILEYESHKIRFSPKRELQETDR